MLKKLETIATKLGPGRTDVWELEMLYKFVNKDLADPYTLDYINQKFINPYKSYAALSARLYNEAISRVTRKCI